MLPALTIFTGAFLLFLVQPLIGKYILPWFGGSPGVWTTCLLFFQTLLLGGYAYAHLTSTWLRPRQQAWLHLGLLVLALAWLPIAPGVDWKPLTGDAPTGRILLLLTACLGLPYLVLSATGPLIQRWFSLTHPGVSPYRLYALSNVGSLLALLGYPFVVEPLLSRAAQSWAWSAGLVVFAGLCGACAWQIRRLPATGAPSPSPSPPPAAASPPPPSLTDHLFWIVLPALASVLLVAITNKLSTDVAVTPFLWVLPLALYLLTFILCFDHPRWYHRTTFSALFAVACAVTWFLVDQGPSAALSLQLVGYAATLFIGGMVCHGELYALRPAPGHLTRFYLCISAGGALGGVFVALIAPRIFTDYHELPLSLWALAYFIGVLCLLGRSRALAIGSFSGTLAVVLLIPALQADPDEASALAWAGAFLGQVRLFAGHYWKEILGVAVLGCVALRGGGRLVAPDFHRRMSAVPLFLSMLLGVVFVIQASNQSRTALESVRNFYGTLKVREYNRGLDAEHYYTLSHGVTTHGIQFAEPPRSLLPISYYGPTSGVGRVVDLLPGGPGRHLGVVGLGAGTLGAYALPGDRLRFYEINPEVVRLAQERFTYLHDTVATVTVVPGDARLTLEAELRRGEPQRFDLLALDAFSSDAIPIHLLTVEAFALYLEHLAPRGVIAVHISNRHLDLRPVTEALARHFGLYYATLADDPDEEEWWLYPTTWVLLSRDPALLADEAIQRNADWPSEDHARLILWTDDRASLLGILK